MDYPVELIAILAHFSTLFSAPTWEKGQLLAIGALLCAKQRTIAAILRIMGRKNKGNYSNYHRVLNRAKWSAYSAGKVLLGLLIRTGITVVPGHLVFALDETVERRQGKKIKAKGCYRDAVRSSESCVVKCFGLKWVCATVILQFPWCKRPWALPYLTVLAHSKKANALKGKKHRTCIDIASQVVLSTTRWLRLFGLSSQVVFLGDGGYAALKFLWTCVNSNATLICRFRLDASLYDRPDLQAKGKRGPKPKKGKKQISLKKKANDPSTKWITQEVFWYSGETKVIEYFSGTSLWYTSGYDPIPIRWVVIRMPETGRIEALCSTDLDLAPNAIIGMFVLRWNIEVLFEEVRRHLGVETQRQWSDLAIERTTPCLFALFSIASLYGIQLWKLEKLKIQKAAWYEKESITFSDILVAVRLEILGKINYKRSEKKDDSTYFLPEMMEAVMQEFLSVA